MKYDIRGQRFGRLIVGRYFNAGAWECECDCGSVKSFYSANLRAGRTQSCGCLNKEASKGNVRRATHGKTLTPEYKVWQGMRQRCENSNDKSFDDYGGRGITVCDRWQSFENFFEDMGKRPAGFSIERKNVNLGYSSENCVWATSKEQNANRRNTIRLSGIPLVNIIGNSYSAEYQRVRKTLRAS